MRKRVLLFVAPLCIFFFFICNKLGAQTVWDGSVDTSWYNDKDKEFVITTASQLAGLAKIVNDGNSLSGKKIKLGDCINLNEVKKGEDWAVSPPANVWTPIGNSEKTKFEGTFDAQMNVVNGMYVKADCYAGLFGYIKGGKIMKLGITNSYIKGNKYVGSIAGVVGSSVTECYDLGVKVIGNDIVGGIAGRLVKGGELEYCNFSQFVSGKNFVGGIVGINEGGTVNGCGSVVEIMGSSVVGGLVGYNSGVLKHSVANYALKGNKIAGGVAGENDGGEIRNCYCEEGMGSGPIGKGTGDAVVRKSEDFMNGKVQELLKMKAADDESYQVE